ncbi:MAG: elongation factor 1-beta [Thermoprotei archaeon]|nr:MAG: elongation factor 1-beta [Thermoprotei archaeon]
MAQVLVVLKVYPKDVMENLEPLVKKIEKALPQEKYKIAKWEPLDIAFGYKALMLYVTMPEETEGGTEELEEVIRGVDEVDNVEVEYITRLAF